MLYLRPFMMQNGMTLPISKFSKTPLTLFPYMVRSSGANFSQRRQKIESADMSGVKCFKMSIFSIVRDGKFKMR